MARLRQLVALVLLMNGSSFASTRLAEEWARSYDGPGHNEDYATAVCVDIAGNVYLTGYSWGDGTEFDYATVKFRPDGTEEWVQRYNGPGNSRDIPIAIVADDDGNVYVTGSSRGEGTDLDYATIKYSADGREEWVRRYNGSYNYTDQVTGMAIAPSGAYVCITGWSFVTDEDGNTSVDAVTIRYDSDGNVGWTQIFDGSEWDLEDRSYAIAIDDAGDAYITGFAYKWYVGGIDFLTIKYDRNGSEAWISRRSVENTDYRGTHVLVQTSGQVCVAGFVIEGQDQKFQTIMYDRTNGAELWERRYSGGDGFANVPLGIASDADGNVYVTGYSGQHSLVFDFATIKSLSYNQS